MSCRAMATLRTQYPHVDFTLISGDNYRITNELLAKDADVVMAYDVSEHVRADVVHTVMEPIGIITTPGHPLTAHSVLSLTDCMPYPLIAPGNDWLVHIGLKALFQGTNPLGSASPMRKGRAY
ncbi:LysR substrate-binding domain-containing protein [Mesorhizobium sp. SB112]|uniref:LysR substrate-binding domain-containing protein n=1 Tax=Mesorhizobium sp. SB112 TaxID=3151853 RepID=UPI003266C129